MKRSALSGAYLKGLEAGLGGAPADACPYEDKRKPSGRLSWSRAFQNAWHEGWEHATTNREQALITLAHTRGVGWPVRPKPAAKRVVHSTGVVARSDGNDTDCGASGDVGKLLLATSDDQVTCKRCLRVRKPVKQFKKELRATRAEARALVKKLDGTAV